MNKKLLLVASLICTGFATLMQAESIPSISRAYSDRFINEVAPSKTTPSIGSLDSVFGNSGSLDVHTLGANTATAAYAVQALADGTFVVLSTDGTNSYFAKYTATGLLDTSFASAGFCTLTGLQLPSLSIFVDEQGRFVVCGSQDSGNGKASWMVRILANGTIDSDWSWSAGSVWPAGSNIYSVSQDMYGNLIAVGNNGSNAQIARYTTTGTLSNNYGTYISGVYTGYIALNGNLTSKDINGVAYPTSSNVLNNFAIDANGNLYAIYLDGSSNAKVIRLTLDGAQDTTFNTGPSAVVAVPALNGAGQLQIALAADGSIIVAGQLTDSSTYWNLVVTNITLASGVGSAKSAVSTFTFNTSTDTTLTGYTINADHFDINSLVTTSDGNIFTVGDDSTNHNCCVIRLTSAGVIDSANFNTTDVYPGLNQFLHDSSFPNLFGASIAPDGKLYVAGYQGSTPYISRLNNDSYVSQVAQYPAERNQGDFDITFGGSDIDSGDGIVRPFDGLYGAHLQQKPEAIIELESGKFLVGMSGKLDTSNASNMILSRLNSDGSVDTCYGSSGFVNLARHCTTGMVITSLLEKLSDNSVLISGYSDSSAIIRLVDHSGSETEIVQDFGSIKSLGVAVQGTQRVLVFNQMDATHGAINAYVPDLSGPDITFNTNGIIYPGMIAPADFGLTNMGPLYGYAIDAQDNIFIAYKNASTNYVDVAKIYADGSGLIAEFGTNGIVSNIFGGGIINAQDVRLALDNEGEVIVAAILASSNTSYTVKRLFAVNGAFDTTFGAVVVALGGTAFLNDLTILNDNTIILTGARGTSSNAMITARVTTTAGVGVVDATFNAQGVTPGILPIQIGHIISSYYDRQATALAIQSSTGNMILAGYEQQSSSLSIPMVMRIYGKSGTTLLQQYPTVGTTDVAGTLDLSFDINNDGGGTGAIDLTELISSGAAKTVYAYRADSPYVGYLLVGIDTGSSVKISRIRESDHSLDTSFGMCSSGIRTLSDLSGLNHVSIDANNKILVAGSQDGSGWAVRLTENGAIDLYFQSLTTVKSINDMAQQESGRYIFVGTDSNNKGVIGAFKDKLEDDDTTLQLDTTFNPLAQTTIATPGLYEISTTGVVPNLVIDSDDTILFAYNDHTASFVMIQKLQANGADIVTDFGSSGAVGTSIASVDDYSVRVAIDGNSKPVVAISALNGTNGLFVMRFLANGSTIDPDFDGQSIKFINHVGSTGVTVGNVIIDSNNKILIFGNNSSGANSYANGYCYAVRLDASGHLDTTWNNAPTGVDSQGILTFTADSSTNIYASSIYINGVIYAAGLGSTNEPLLLRIFGDDYVGQLEQQPFEVLPGIIDATLDVEYGSNSLNFSDYYFDCNLSGYTSQKIYIYPSGAMIFGFSNGTNSIVVKLKADESLDTSFNSSGTPGYATISSIKNLEDLFVADGTNDDASIYLVGNDGDGNMVAAKLDAAGISQTFITPNTEDLTYGSTIRRSTNSRTLIAGFDGGSGVIVAYDNTDCSVDLSFANGAGAYYTGVNSIIPCMELDINNRMYIAYYNDGNITVQRIEANGSQVDPTFNAANITATHFLSSSQIKLAIDDLNNQLVVAVQDGTCHNNIIKVHRYNLTDGSSAGCLESQITIMCKTLNLSDLFIDDIQNIYVVGYNSTDNNVIVARIKSNCAEHISLDTNYAANGGTPGIANVSAGSMMTVSAGAYHPDRRVYVMGQSCTPTPFMARIFGDVYVSQDDQASFVAVPGTVDLTLDPNDMSQDGGIIISNIANWSSLSGYTAQGVHANPDGTAYIILDNGSNWVLAKADCDMNDASFGTNGLAATVCASSVNTLAIDSQDRILVAGLSLSGDHQKVYRYMTDGNCYNEFSSDVALTSVSRIAEQKSGRVLVSGYQLYDSYHTYGGGTIVAYKHDGSALDFTYGPECANGFYSIHLDAAIDDMVVNCNDDAFIVYRDTTVKLQKITANGSGLDAIFNSGAIVDTGIVATEPAHIGINCAGNILVGASSGVTIKTAMYDGSTGAIIGSVQDLCSQDMNTPILTGITGAGDEFVMSAYETTNGEMNQMLTIRMTSAGIIDTAFNPDGVPGVAESDPQAAINMNGISVQPDGRIVMVGNNASYPVLMRVYGTPYVKEYAQYPDKVTAGILDTTLFPCHGDLNLKNLLESSLCLAGYTARKIYIDACAKTLLALDNGSDTLLVRLNKDLTLDSCFGNSGHVRICGDAGVTGLAVDSNNNIYVTGGVDRSWIRAFNHDGSPLCGFTLPSEYMYASYQIKLQSLDRIIVAGFDGEVGAVLAGYTSTTGILDPEFGNNYFPGAYVVGAGVPVADMAIDSLDRIYIVLNDGSNNSVVQRINTNGSLLDTDFGTPTGFACVTGNELKVLVDNSNSHVIVAAATGHGFKIQTYSTVDGSTVNGPIEISAGGSSTSHIANIFVTSEDKIVLVGYETTDNQIVVTRFNADLSYDSSFNGGDVLMASVGNMVTAFDTTMHPDDRIMIVGGNLCNSRPYMCRVYGDDYVTVDSQEPDLGIAGTLDATFNLGDAYINLNTLSSSLHDSSATAVLPLINGKQYVAVDNGSSASHIILLTEDAISAPILDSSFGSSGISCSAPQGVLSMILDGMGKIILVGTDDNGWIKRYTSSGFGDTCFGTSGLVDEDDMNSITTVVEQSLARIVTAGLNAAGKSALRAYTNLGVLDTTFNSLGATPGEFSFNDNSNGIYSMVADRYDRLIIAYLNSSYSTAEIARFTSDGELDITFGTNNTGIISSSSQSYFPTDYVFTVTSSTAGVGTGTIGSDYIVIYTGETPIYYLQLIATPTIIDIDDVPTSVYLDGATVRVQMYGDSENFTDIVINASAAETTFGNLTITGTSTVLTTGALIGLNEDPSSVKVLLDQQDRIIIAGVSQDGTSINVAAYDNGTAALNNGQPVECYTAGTPITELTDAVISSLIATEDQKVLVGGYESCHSDMWIARLTRHGELDTCFNPDSGIQSFMFDGCSTARHNNAMAIFEDGRISSVGYETVSGCKKPFAARIYDHPYTSQIAECLDSQPVGTSDLTLGLNGEDGVSFFALSSSEDDTVAQDQVARAIALQGDTRIVVALDGQDLTDSSSRVFINRFNIDGILDTTFNETGQIEVPHLYENEHVQDMVAFATTSGVNKAILAGYATTGCPTNFTTSWLMQYNLDTAELDTTFGGIDNDGPGTASGDIAQLNTVTLQASGRVITSGLNFDGTGAILGYSPLGKLDNSFGSQGYYFSDAPTGIYSHAIDSQDRVVFAYNNGTGTVVLARLLADGSDLDPSFNGTGFVTTLITGITTSPTDQIRVAVNSADEIYVAVVNYSSTQYAVTHYDTTGNVIGDGGANSDGLDGVTSLTIARLLVDTQGKVTIIGTDHSANDDYLIVKLTSGLSLDTAVFNETGYLKYKINSDNTTREARDGVISADGRIYVVGDEANPEV